MLPTHPGFAGDIKARPTVSVPQRSVAMFWSSALLLGLVQLAASKPLVRRWDDFEVKHAWAEVPRGWELHAPAPSDYTFDMRIGLKQDRFDELVAALYEVSDPAHQR